MEKRLLFQDNPSQFFLLVARIISVLITGVYLIYMMPEFIDLLCSKATNNEAWKMIFCFLSIVYAVGFLLSFWKVGLGGFLLLISSILITLYAFIDSKSLVVLFLFIPLSFSGILFLIHWKKNKTSS